MEDDDEEEVAAYGDADGDRDTDEVENEQGRQEEVECGDEVEEEGDCGGTGSASCTSSGLYLRGPASLPPTPPVHQRPVIRPEGQK